MNRRPADVDKWNDPWFRELSPEQKSVWFFLCEQCDRIGRWRVDLKQIEFYLGLKTSLQEMESWANKGEDRIVSADNRGGTDLLILGFIDLQYGKLNANRNPHKRVIRLIESASIDNPVIGRALAKALPANLPANPKVRKALKIKTKGEGESPKVGAGEGGEGGEKREAGERAVSAHAPTALLDAFSSFWSAYPRKAAKISAFNAFGRAIKKTTIEVILRSIETQKNSDNWLKDGGKFIPHPTTWLNGGRWEDEHSGIYDSREDLMAE